MLPLIFLALLNPLPALANHRNLPRDARLHERLLPITATTTVLVEMTRTETVWVQPTDQAPFGPPSASTTTMVEVSQSDGVASSSSSFTVDEITSAVTASSTLITDPSPSANSSVFATSSASGSGVRQVFPETTSDVSAGSSVYSSSSASGSGVREVFPETTSSVSASSSVSSSSSASGSGVREVFPTTSATSSSMSSAPSSFSKASGSGVRAVFPDPTTTASSSFLMPSSSSEASDSGVRAETAASSSSSLTAPSPSSSASGSGFRAETAASSSSSLTAPFSSSSASGSGVRAVFPGSTSSSSSSASSTSEASGSGVRGAFPEPTSNSTYSSSSHLPSSASSPSLTSSASSASVTMTSNSTSNSSSTSSSNASDSKSASSSGMKSTMSSSSVLASASDYASLTAADISSSSSIVSVSATSSYTPTTLYTVPSASVSSNVTLVSGSANLTTATSSMIAPASSSTAMSSASSLASNASSSSASTASLASSSIATSSASASTASSTISSNNLEPLPTPMMAGYYPDWSGGYLTPEDVDWSKYDVLDFAFALPTSSFGLEFSQDDSSSLLKRLVATGHAAGKRVKLSIGGWTGSKYFSTICKSSANRKTFVKNIIAAVDLYDLDGIDIDWEYPGTTGNDGNAVSPSDSANFLLFLTELRAALPAGSLISTATQVWPYAGPDGAPMADVSGFAKIIDYILIMNYDIWGSSTTPGANAPLSDGCNNSTQPLANAYAAISSWTTAGMPANQITLGLPAYGYLQMSAATGLKDRRSIPSPPGRRAKEERGDYVTVYNDNSGSADGQVMFEALISQGALALDSSGSYVGAGGFTREWDSCSSTPWLKSKKSGQVITYDDPASISLKAQFALQAGLRGCNVFSIDGDYTGSGFPLTDAARSGLGF